LLEWIVCSHVHHQSGLRRRLPSLAADGLFNAMRFLEDFPNTTADPR